MIKKFAEIKAPLEPVRDMFLKVEAWPEWMPGIRSATVQKRGDNFAQVQLMTVFRGNEFQQVMDFRMEANRFQQRQISGRFKKWSAEWRFQPSADGTGTVLHVALDIDLGFLGYFLPSGVMDSVLNEWFTGMVREAELRVRKQEIKAAVSKPAAAPLTLAPRLEALPQRQIKVFQTANGLEVWIQDQKYLIPLSSS